MSCKWFRRRTREYRVEPVHITHGNISVTHTVRREPDPKPTTIYLVWHNQNGQRWQSAPFRITGQQSFPIDVPIAWLTGRDEDISKLPLSVTVMMDYQQ